MNQVLNANDDVSNVNSDAGSKVDSKIGLRACSESDFDLNNVDKANLVSEVLATEVDKSQIKKKKEHKSNKSNVVKLANLFDEMFEYIYVAHYQKLYFLA